MLQGGVEGDGAAHRKAEEVGALDAEVGEQAGEVGGRGVGAAGWTGPAEAAGVVAEDEEALGEGVHLVVPHPGVGDAGVEEDEGVAGATDLVGEAGAVHLGDAGAGRRNGLAGLVEAHPNSCRCEAFVPFELAGDGFDDLEPLALVEGDRRRIPAQRFRRHGRAAPFDRVS